MEKITLRSFILCVMGFILIPTGLFASPGWHPDDDAPLSYSAYESYISGTGKDADPTWDSTGPIETIDGPTGESPTILIIINDYIYSDATFQTHFDAYCNFCCWRN